MSKSTSFLDWIESASLALGFWLGAAPNKYLTALGLPSAPTLETSGY